MIVKSQARQFVPGGPVEGFERAQEGLLDDVVRLRATSGEPERRLVQRVEADESDLLELT